MINRCRPQNFYPPSTNFSLSLKNSPYNFLKIKTDLGRIKYYNLYSEIFDARNIFDLKKKFLAIHYLSFKFNKFFDFGVFESVIWQADNLSYNRGFDISYLNPIIFYRPVEFSKNSPDNVMMGLASNHKGESPEKGDLVRYWPEKGNYSNKS